MLAHIDEIINDSDRLTATKRAELRGVISTKPGLNLYPRVTPRVSSGSMARIRARGEPERQVPARHLRPKLARSPGEYAAKFSRQPRIRRPCYI